MLLSDSMVRDDEDDAEDGCETAGGAHFHRASGGDSQFERKPGPDSECMRLPVTFEERNRDGFLRHSTFEISRRTSACEAGAPVVTGFATKWRPSLS